MESYGKRHCDLCNREMEEHNKERENHLLALDRRISVSPERNMKGESYVDVCGRCEFIISVGISCGLIDWAEGTTAKKGIVTKRRKT